MVENSIKEDIEILENFINACNEDLYAEIVIKCDGLTRNAIEHILSDYKRVLKENEELLELKVSASAHNRILKLEKENKELKTRLDEISKINFPIIN